MTPSTFTLEDVVNFCHENKSLRAFKDREWGEIAREIVDANDSNDLHIVTDDKGICGAIIITIAAEDKTIYIHQIVCVRNGFRTLVQTCFKLFPDYILAGLRNGKLKHYTRKNLYG